MWTGAHLVPRLQAKKTCDINRRSFRLYGGILFCQCSLDHNGAFQTLLLHLAGEIEGIQYIAHILPVVGVAAAAAVELGPAVLALGLVIYSGPGEVILHLLIDGEIEYIAHLPLFMTNAI